MQSPATAGDARWVPACQVGALPEGKILPVMIEGRALILVREGGRIHAADRACPHERADLARGRCENGRLLCPRHLAWIDLNDGTVPGWLFGRRLGIYPVQVVGDQICIDAAAIPQPVAIAPL